MSVKKQTAFSTMEYQFPNASNKLKTLEFLEAASCTVRLIERCGKVFSPIIYDMNGNITKLRRQYDVDIEEFNYLEDMILKEQEGGTMIATDALLWLKRALSFLLAFYQAFIDDTMSKKCCNDLGPLLVDAYKNNLEQHHGWLGKQLFNIISKYAPNRRTLMNILALNQSECEDDVIKDMQAYVTKLGGCVSSLNDFYTTNNLEP